MKLELPAILNAYYAAAAAVWEDETLSYHQKTLAARDLQREQTARINADRETEHLQRTK